MFFSEKNRFYVSPLQKFSVKKGKLHSVSKREEDGLSSYYKISIFDFLTKIEGTGGGTL